MGEKTPQLVAGSKSHTGLGIPSRRRTERSELSPEEYKEQVVRALLFGSSGPLASEKSNIARDELVDLVLEDKAAKTSIDLIERKLLLSGAKSVRGIRIKVGQQRSQK